MNAAGLLLVALAMAIGLVGIVVPLIPVISIAGMIADPGISPYVAAKHGVIGLSKAAAIEYANQGIRINALAPGLVETPMTKHWFDDPQIRSHFLLNSPIGRAVESRARVQQVRATDQHVRVGSWSAEQAGHAS